MHTISCRSLAAVIEVLEAESIPVEPLLAGLDFDLSFVRSGREQIDWESGIAFFMRVYQHLGSAERLEEIGEKVLFTSVFSRARELMSELPDAWQLYRVIRFWMLPSLFPGTSRRMFERADGTIEFVSAEESFRPIGPYAHLLIGVFRVVPTLIGEGPSEVSLTYNESSSTYTIVPPKMDPRTRAERQRSERAVLATMALRELIDQQFDIQSTWLEYHRTIEALTERNRRTEGFNRLSQALAERVEVDGLVRVILAVMLVDFRFQGAVLELTISQGDTQRWGAGDRDSAADYTYPFAITGNYRGLLELWGPANYNIGDEDDPVAAIMPWLTLALTNAVAFHNLDAERIRSEDRLNALIEARDEIINSENKYRVLVEEASDAIVVFSARSLQILEVNRALCQMLTFDREELLAMRIHEVLEPMSNVNGNQELAQLMRGQTVRTTRMAVTRDGERLALECASKMLDDERIQLIARDVTQWEAAKARIRESEERYAVAVRGAADGIWDWNLRTGNIYFSERWKEMLGFADDEIETSPEEWLGRVHEEDVDAVNDAIERHILGEDENLSVEYRIRAKSGEWIWVHARGLALRDASNAAHRMAGSQTDITERKNFEKKLYHAAFHDALTGLPNRAWCNDWLVQRLEDPTRQGFGVLYFDLDRFKVVNDSLGHIFGDQILSEVAVRLNAALPANAQAARIGGDEFVILVQGEDSVGLLRALADEVLAIFREPFRLDKRNFILTCSIGITTSAARPYERPEQVMRDADLAMYEAKNAGQGRIEIYTEELYTKAHAKMDLEVSLRQALDNGELELVYQPIVEGITGNIVSAEALARWPKGREGGVPPDEFIPLAEESGLIHALGRWAIEVAASDLRDWLDTFPDRPNLSVGVNLSPLQFYRDDLVSHVREVMQRYRIPHNSLILEITENALISQDDIAIERILELKEAGALVVIDDLGTGYSSLSYLVRLPVDFVKIDRSFVQNVEQDHTHRSVATALLRLTQSLGKKVVAEGVESQGARELISSIVPEALQQGYLFSKPVCAKTLKSLLERRSLP